MYERSTRMQLWKDMAGNLTEKKAELAGTYDMPWSPSGKRKNEKPGGEKAVIKRAEADPPVEYADDIYPGTEHAHSEGMRNKLKEMSGKGVMPEKTASALTEDDLLKQAFGLKTDAENVLPSSSDPSPGDNENQTLEDETIKKQPQPKTLKPTVDVTSHEAPKLVTQKTASRHALPSQGKYPLDGYDQVKMASVYFDEWHKRMPPEMRREFCSNMVKRAHELGIDVSPLAECYGSDKYATAGQIKQAMDARRTVLHGSMDPLHELVAENSDLVVLNKLAEAQPGMLPNTFAAALGEYDRMVGLDHHYGGDIPDPFYSTFFKGAAVKQEAKTDPDDTIIVGNEVLPRRKLVTYSKLGRDAVKLRFGEEFADEFSKDPNAIFNSLPRDQKLVMLRMASSGEAQHQSATKS